MNLLIKNLQTLFSLKVSVHLGKLQFLIFEWSYS